MTARPTEESKRALVKASSSPDEEVAETATLGLGNMVKRMNDSESGDPSDVVSALVERLGKATTDAERRLCLSDPAAEVRRAAAGALTYRLITPMLDLVSLVLKNDPDEGRSPWRPRTDVLAGPLPRRAQARSAEHDGWEGWAARSGRSTRAPTRGGHPQCWRDGEGSA